MEPIEENANNFSRNHEVYLEHEEFIQSVLNTRDPKKKEKRTWQIFLESAGGAALITVVIGGLFGAIISGSIQRSIDSRAFKNEMNKALITEQLKTTREAVQLIGKLLVTSENVMLSQKWDFTRFPEENHEAVRRQQREFRDDYNRAIVNWHEERRSIGFLLSYYHNNQPEINEVWTDVQTELNTYIECASNFAQGYVEQTACDSVDNIERSLQELLKKLEIEEYNSIAKY